ncbi:MAG: sulfatase-like hydrolase/transferase [Krumholzibacteria bacterium]|nr:sulfatase-like hydrolase/transferase [Candidatus Krumholzibacteria bacterium]
MKSLPLLLVLLLLVSCERAPRRTTLVAYDFAAPQPSPVLVTRPAWGRDFGLHHFGEGWEFDGSPGWWVLHPGATASLYLMGTGGVLTLVAAVPPELAAAGQTLTVALNGRDLAIFPLERGWSPDTLRVAVPDAVLRQGLNTLELKPQLSRSALAGPDDPERRPLGVFVQGLTVTADLDHDQLPRWARWHDLRIAGTPWENVPVPARAARPRDRTDRPDLIVLVLDALRPDHLGHRGYGRDTSPVLDRLAAEGVVFANVVAQASYTRCAVPGLLTGLPWTDHGVVRGVVWEDRDALADSFVTLPETLTAAGYHTIGVSHNPNFSAATGMSQGFAEFTEAWADPDFAGVPAERPERLVVERLAAGLPAGPVGLWVHLLPPHQPYAPGPEHDLWREGPLADLDEGIMDHLRACENPDTTVAAGLPERLVALYDGNIRRVDAAVGLILEAWQGLGRDRELVVAVVSDHGEAFGEHGRWDHCTTVYDEMTRVPLLVWPRGLCPEWADHTDAYLGLEDVAPLLLRLLDVPLAGHERLPRRFLEVYARGPRDRDAVVVRSTTAYDILGLRTDRYLAVWDGMRRQELYDLAADPGAAENLRFAQPELYNDLVGRLHGILRSGSWLGGGAPVADLSPEDLKALKSLGYL